MVQGSDDNSDGERGRDDSDTVMSSGRAELRGIFGGLLVVGGSVWNLMVGGEVGARVLEVCC